MLRGGVWYLVQRVPGKFAHLETREIVRASTRTGNRREAERIALQMKAALFARWQAGLATKAGNPRGEAEALLRLAQASGFTFRTADALAAGPLEDMIARLETLAAHDPQARDPVLAKAVLGAAEPGRAVRLSELFDAYEAMTPDLRNGMSADQIRRWRNPRIKVLDDLRKCIGDKALSDIDRSDALGFRDRLWGKVGGGAIAVETANKQLNYLNGMLNRYGDLTRLDWTNPFAGISFANRAGEKRARAPVSRAWITAHLAAPAALPGLNPQARDILLAMVNTGARPSEIIGLLPGHIRLDAPIPHIMIRAAGRVLKTQHASRDIPLHGLSLTAMQRNPQGFPRYRGKAGWSNLVNAYLRAHCALEAAQSAYSLRHAFEDRLLAAGAVDRLAADLMDHSTRRERYGDGASLAQKSAILQRIAI
jgi:integrase